MFIEQPPFFYRALFPGVIWRIPAKKKCVYLTFDDGPIPEVTPWVLDTLDKYGIKATFFCVGDNVRMYPVVYQMVLDRGHKVGKELCGQCKESRRVDKEQFVSPSSRSHAVSASDVAAAQL